MIRVRLRHVASAGFCVRGARQKAFALGIDWRDFVRNGISVEDAERIPDAQVMAIVAAAKKEAGLDQG